MASSDIKHDYNMEAGLLSTHGEERISEKQAQFQDSELAIPSDNTRTTSYARRGLIALAVVCLVGVGLVSIGGATGVCPGHLRHALHGDITVKDAIHSHKPNLSDSMARMVRRQNNNTPGASSNTDSGDSSTAVVSQPSATEAVSTDEASETAAATSPAAEASQTSDTNEASSTAAQESSTQEAPSSTREEAASSTEQSAAATTTAEQPSSTAAETTADSQSTSEAESSTDSDEASSTKSETSQKTITTGTRTTSSAVAKVLTSTLSDGGITTLTSTSWVQVVPHSEATTTGDPGLQNAAPQSSGSGVLAAVIGMMFGGLFLV